jgi:electron transfer flavoprotein alpha subunit
VARTKTIERRTAPAADLGFDDAEVIVTAGRGVGNAENLAVVRAFAEIFRKAAVAGSRPVCDDGWLPLSRQVGVTGATVAPKVYVACGVSGAQQHLAGMRGSGFVVAVNRDADAPMMRHADACIVEDLTDFLPRVVRAHRGENE